MGPVPVPTPPGDQPGELGGDDGPGGVTGWIVDGVTSAIDGFFRTLVADALNPLLDLLGRTLLTTPPPESLPTVGRLWENNRVFAVAAYVLLVMAAGLVLMAHETVQTRYSVKELAPRIVVGFLAANLSLFLAGHAIAFANAATQAVLGDALDPDTAAATLTALVMGALNESGIFVIFIGLALAAALVALLVAYVVRVALTVILLIGAPLALACHGLPQTEGVAYWWWRAFFAVLAIQLAQSLTLVTALNVFFAPGGFTLFGPATDGLVNLIVTLALFYILFKIPLWLLHQVQIGGGRSFVGGLVKGYIAYKTLGLLRGHSPGGQPPPPRGGGGSSSGGSRGPSPGPGTPPTSGRGSGPAGHPPATSPAGPTRPSPQPRPPTRAVHPATRDRHSTVGDRVHRTHHAAGERSTLSGRPPGPAADRATPRRTDRWHSGAGEGLTPGAARPAQPGPTSEAGRVGWPTLRARADAGARGPSHSPAGLDTRPRHPSDRGASSASTPAPRRPGTPAHLPAHRTPPPRPRTPGSGGEER